MINFFSFFNIDINIGTIIFFLLLDIEKQCQILKKQWRRWDQPPLLTTHSWGWASNWCCQRYMYSNFIDIKWHDVPKTLLSKDDLNTVSCQRANYKDQKSLCIEAGAIHKFENTTIYAPLFYMRDALTLDQKIWGWFCPSVPLSLCMFSVFGHIFLKNL